MRKFPIEISRAGCMQVLSDRQTRFIAYAGQRRFATGVTVTPSFKSIQLDARKRG
jgi:hypothetical protein